MSGMSIPAVPPAQTMQKLQLNPTAQEEADRQAAQTSAEGREIVRQSDSFSFSQEDEASSLLDRMIEAQKKAKEQKEKFRIPQNTRYGDRTIEAYARLARARRQTDVSAAASYARRQISQLKAAKRRDSENADRIQATINQLQKAVTRAGKKKRDLEREQLTEVRRRRMEEKKNFREARRLRQELRRKQALRFIREKGYIKEAEIDNRHQEQMAIARAEYQAQLEKLGAAGDAPAVQQYVAQMAADGSAPMPTPELSMEA